MTLRIHPLSPSRSQRMEANVAQANQEPSALLVILLLNLIQTILMLRLPQALQMHKELLPTQHPQISKSSR